MNPSKNLFNARISFRKPLLLASLSALAFASCTTTEPEPSPYESGVVVMNAGNFTDNNGTLSFIPSGAAVASTDIFRTANMRPLTGSLQGYTEVDGKGIILVDNSTAGLDKVEIVEVGTFKSLATLAAPDIENPRHVLRVSPNKAYISCWGATGSDFSNFWPNPGYIAVVDLASRKVTKKIMVTKGAERMLLNGSEVLVGSAGGEKALASIDIATDELKQKLDVGTNPQPIGLDAAGQLWVYANKEMIQMNAGTKAIGSRLKVNVPADRSINLITMGGDRQTIFFASYFYDAADGYKQKGELYRFSTREGSISLATPYLRRVFSAFGVNPKDGTLYAGVTPSYKQAGYVLRYEPVSARLIDSVKVEIGPSGFFFK